MPRNVAFGVIGHLSYDETRRLAANVEPRADSLPRRTGSPHDLSRGHFLVSQFARAGHSLRAAHHAIHRGKIV